MLPRCGSLETEPKLVVVACMIAANHLTFDRRLDNRRRGFAVLQDAALEPGAFLFVLTVQHLLRATERGQAQAPWGTNRGDAGGVCHPLPSFFFFLFLFFSSDFRFHFTFTYTYFGLIWLLLRSIMWRHGYRSVQQWGVC